MQAKIKIECPYCGHGNSVEINTHTPEVLVCDIDCGGCDREFLVKPKVVIECEVYTMERKKKNEKS